MVLGGGGAEGCVGLDVCLGLGFGICLGFVNKTLDRSSHSKYMCRFFDRNRDGYTKYICRSIGVL
jgi:hypothetical protein